MVEEQHTVPAGGEETYLRILGRTSVDILKSGGDLCPLLVVLSCVFVYILPYTASF